MMNAIYGGRVDNDYDTRVLRTYLQQFFTPAMLGGGRGGRGQAQLLPGVTRAVPLPGSTTSRDEFIGAIASLDDSDGPVMFGLPLNIQRSLQRANSARVVGQLKALASLTGAAAKFDREKWRVGLQSILELWDRLVGNLDVGSGGAGGERMEELSPVDAFVVMEEAFSVTLLRKVGGDMSSVKRVVMGSGLLTPSVQATAGALLAGEVPRAWSKRWEGPEQPTAFLRGLVVRRQALSRWRSRMASGTLLDGEICLGDIFNPGTFLNALRQQVTPPPHTHKTLKSLWI